MKTKTLMGMVVLWVGLLAAPVAAQADWVRVYGKDAVVRGRGPVVVVCDSCRVYHKHVRCWYPNACRSRCRAHLKVQYKSWYRTHERRYHRDGDHYFVGAAIHSPGLTVIFRSHD
ncbi:hypothetical protein SAMN02745206_00278 [Desulfacinum infernum DSM 9756]|uniref:Uncharacterized protein n=1 Tax=Desulfacinum infernum DSM 9756 TaxID=1121391 RepID=A0A1M4TGR0_9BACT|nr:hypothetical protein [Desulfacinum infernum]SHE43641.1 hypothetical protein SAMN02745206_00278 [Desulfacinum infernum DSM 9756]